MEATTEARVDGDTPSADGAGGGGRAGRAAVPVSQAFSLGWNLCLLYLSDAVPGWDEWEDAPPQLPAPSGFSGNERALIRLGQVRTSLDRFNSHFAAIGGDGALLSTAATHLGPLSQESETQGEKSNPRCDLYKAHRALAQALSAGDARLARAYHLGVALAKLTRTPQGEESLKERFERPTVAEVGEGLADLSSLLPDHTSRAVRLSCTEWQRWVAKPQMQGKGEIRWSEDGDEVGRALVRQGEIWRALLSGEKSATAMLELHDYFAAGVRAVKHGARLLRGVLIPLLIALALLLVGSFLLIKDPGAGATAVGVVTVAGSIGITWKGILGVLSSVASKLQRPVWGAALDEQIASAITVLPSGAKAVAEDAAEAAPASGPPPEAFAPVAESTAEAA